VTQAYTGMAANER